MDTPEREPRNVLQKNQGLWTAVFLFVGLGLAAWWILRNGTGLEEEEKALFVRVATFNTSLHRDEGGQLAKDLKGGQNEQARKIAEILQWVEPDIVLLNEFDYDPSGDALQSFRDEYLGVAQGKRKALTFKHVFVAEVNTGVQTGLDLDQNGVDGEPGDAFGYGKHPGQYGMVVLSRYPIDEAKVRTFQRFLWRDMPDNRMPTDFYPENIQADLRLSSKSHWDVPIQVTADKVLHLLASHPTPPVFDGPEDRNGRRNADEIRLWTDYVTPGRGGYIEDDEGGTGGLAEGEWFVVVGDLNADPIDGDGDHDAIRALLSAPTVHQGDAPSSAGGEKDAMEDFGANSKQKGPPAEDTGDFADTGGGPGNLRIDYALPSKNLEVLRSGVFWPLPNTDGANLIDASDHRLVWVDLKVGSR